MKEYIEVIYRSDIWETSQGWDDIEKEYIEVIVKEYIEVIYRSDIWETSQGWDDI
jgi:hypothetical protein